MIKYSLLTVSAIAFGWILVSIMVTGVGVVSVFSATTSSLLAVGTAAAVSGMLMRDECGPGRRCF